MSKLNSQLFVALVFLSFFSPFPLKAQTVNSGNLVIRPDTHVITLSDLINKKPGVIVNDGNLYITSNYHNDGLMLFTERLKKGYTIFSNKRKQRQILSGSTKSEFFDVLFDNQTSDIAFSLFNDFQIFGTANFYNGIIDIDHNLGSLFFDKEGKAINASNKSYAQGEVEKSGKNNFVYPLGKKGYYRPAAIIDPVNPKTHINVEYFLESPDSSFPVSNKAGVLETVNNTEYWTIHRVNPKGIAIVELSWNANTTDPNLLKEDIETFHVVRWDSEQNMWVDEGGIVDTNTKTVRTPTQINHFGVFTLATVNSEKIAEGGVIIYNAVSPNGDGYNDFFRIENIEQYPNNRVQIYNRWGVKVFERSNYKNDENAFIGISEGRGTINKNEKLSTGTYYYVIKYEHTDEKGSEMITRSGYLHLENN